nr:TIGR02530 family flagellar biosynthesis protein [Cohnella hashimotonis]
MNVGFAARNAAPIVPTARPVIRGSKDDKLQDGNAFKTMLSAQSLKFSQHAEQRLAQRGIKLGPEQLSAIATAVDQASAKGAKDSLVLYQNMAMIVNVPSRTVITAMDDKSMQQHVFTNIDSAVVVK